MLSEPEERELLDQKEWEGGNTVIIHSDELGEWIKVEDTGDFVDLSEMR